MQLSLSSLLECLIILSQDEIEDVADYSSNALKKLSCMYESASGKSFLENIEECLYAFLTRFPRVVLSSDGISQMNLIKGYLTLLGPSLPHVLSTETHLNRLLFCLIHVAQFDVSDVSLLHVPSLRDIGDATTNKYVEWKNVLLVHGGDVLFHLKSICEVLRESGNINIITHALIDQLHENHQYTNEILLILNTFLTTGCDDSMTIHANLLKEVLQIYLDFPVWPASSILNKGSVGIHEDQLRIVQLCLTIEGMGKMSSVVGRRIFNSWLLQCLYSILEAAGSPLEIVSVTGLQAVKNIANVCANDDLTTLICNNADYLAHHITKRLRHYHRHPDLLAVLSVIMQYSTIEVLPSLHEIISDVLQQSYNTFQVNNIHAYLRTFYTFICSVRRWHVESKHSESSVIINQKCKTIKTDKTPLELLLDYRKSKLIVENLDSSDSDNDDERSLQEKFADHYNLSRNCQDESSNMKEPSEEEIVEQKKEVPLHITLVVQILERSLHFLSSKDSMLRVLVLEVLNEGILLLEVYPDHLLPLVHSIWSPLINRFRLEETEPLVVQRAFSFLLTLASTSRDFIRQRTLKDVLPSVCNILKKKAHESLRKDAKSAYRLTQQYKLQKCLLEGLGKLAADIELAESSINEIIHAGTPYLSCFQPQPLQDASVQLFTMIANISCDLVWLHLITIWSPTSILKSNCSLLAPVQLPTSDNSEYKKNIQTLMVLLG